MSGGFSWLVFAKEIAGTFPFYIGLAGCILIMLGGLIPVRKEADFCTGKRTIIKIIYKQIVRYKRKGRG